MNYGLTILLSKIIRENTYFKKVEQIKKRPKKNKKSVKIRMKKKGPKQEIKKKINKKKQG